MADSTLSVPKEFSQDLRENYEGSNDKERLENWAEQYSPEGSDYITKSEAEDLIERKIEEAKRH